MTFLLLITPHMNKFVITLGALQLDSSPNIGDAYCWWWWWRQQWWRRWWRRWWQRGRRSLTLAARSFRCTNETCNHSCHIKCNCTLALAKPAVSTDHVAWGSREWHTQNHHIKTTFCSNCLGNWSITSSVISCVSPKLDSGKHTLPGPRNA